MQAVFKQITGDGIAETVEEVGAYADKGEINPGFVAEKVGKGLEGEFFRADGFEALFCEKAAGKGAKGCDAAKDGAKDCILMLGSSADEFLKIGEGQQRHESHCICTNHAVGGELVLFIVVACHDTQE